MTKIVLQNIEPGLNPDSRMLAETIMARVGLLPRKKGATEKMHNVLLQLYEAMKEANREKKPERAVLTVEEMALFAGITRQTMYEYLNRWTSLNLITKTSYIRENKVVIGYRLNGTTIENAFEKAILAVNNHLTLTQKYIQELQKTVKNEKLRAN